MLFNSIHFICFFPIILIIYFLIPRKFRYIFLLAASYYFYMCWNPKYIVLLIITTIITYLSGILIDCSDQIADTAKRIRYKKLWVAISFIFNLGILFFYKYFNFVWDNMNILLEKMGFSIIEDSFHLLLPVGISFYTFQALSYTMDIYRKDTKVEKNILKYALFVSFFPSISSGPIERSKNLIKQVNDVHNINLWNFPRIKEGCLTMLYGFFLKLVIADRVAILVNQVYDNYLVQGSISLILASVFFSIQIYCDFASYSTIAIGAAKIMGFQLMENFNTPYLSESVAEFWRRWHISLSTWFRDYLYIPLGGNRKGTFRKNINLMITFLVSGLWHGANWTFIAWGGLNGLYQVIGQSLKSIKQKIYKKTNYNINTFSAHFGKIISTFILIDISWIFFRADSLSQAFKFMSRIITKWDPWTLFDGSLYTWGLSQQEFHIAIIAIVFLLILDILRRYFDFNGVVFMSKQNLWFQYTAYLMMITVILVFGIYGRNVDAAQFIYLQF